MAKDLPQKQESPGTQNLSPQEISEILLTLTERLEQLKKAGESTFNKLANLDHRLEEVEKVVVSKEVNGTELPKDFYLGMSAKDVFLMALQTSLLAQQTVNPTAWSSTKARVRASLIRECIDSSQAVMEVMFARMPGLKEQALSLLKQ